MKELYVGKSKIQGKGIFIREGVKKGSRIGFVAGAKKKFCPKTKKDSESIPRWFGVSKCIWIDPGNSIFRFYNHSCNPNTAIIGTKTIVARRDIKAGEEITIDYSMTDADPAWTLEYTCLCGSKNCRKIIRSIQHLKEKTVKEHLPFIPQYFFKAYKRVHPDAKL